MSRRVSLPGADELFRPTEGRSEPDHPARSEADPDRVGDLSPVSARVEPPANHAPPAQPGPRGSSGRVRHDEKITVYVTADELVDIERTRLRLRSDHGLAVDRGRIVREAIHLALEAVETDGEASALIRRLREQ